MKSIMVIGALLICAAAPAAEIHPIVEIQSGYLFGATADGKWMKAEEAAKALTDETTYRIYGLTQSFGEGRDVANLEGRSCAVLNCVDVSRQTGRVNNWRGFRPPD